MWTKAKIEKVLLLLRGAYGIPEVRRRSNPVDELIRTVLSQHTSDRNSLAAFAALKRRFGSWAALRTADTRTIARTIWGAGLARVKAVRIKELLAEIERREGRLDLSAIGRLSGVDARTYLLSLKGVGPKTAACVLLFSFGRPFMPVDTHIFRVAQRLGMIGERVGIDAAHDLLTRAVSKRLIYEFHLSIIEHGRRTCGSQSPRCGSCVLYGVCSFRMKGEYRKGALR